MTNIFGDGYEAATEPGPDVEVKVRDDWEKRGDNISPLWSDVIYRRPIKLQAGERYRMRDGRIVDDLTPTKSNSLYREMYAFWSEKHQMTWTRNGKMCSGESDVLKHTDLVEHIEKQPKENSMNTIKVPPAAVGFHFADGSSEYHITLDQAIALGEQAKAMKADAEIKVGDFVMVHKHRLGRAINCNEGFIEVSGFISCIAATACRKVHGTPAELAFLNAVFDGAK